MQGSTAGTSGLLHRCELGCCDDVVADGEVGAVAVAAVGVRVGKWQTTVAVAWSSAATQAAAFAAAESAAEEYDTTSGQRKTQRSSREVTVLHSIRCWRETDMSEPQTEYSVLYVRLVWRSY